MKIDSRHQLEKRLSTLIEHQTVFHSERSELNMFETYKVAKEVDLTFDYPVIVNMLRGKKIMHLDNFDDFDFYPGETLIMPLGKEMIIDFPEATFETPTHCLALGIDPSRINEVVNQYSSLVQIENDPKVNWEITNNPSRVDEQQEIQHLMNRLIYTFTNNHPSREVLLDIMLKELIVRLLQTNAKVTLLNATGDLYNNHRIAFATKYIKNHLTEKLSIDTIADKVHMSTSHFHRVFKHAIGASPIQFLVEERIKFSKKLLNQMDLPISEVASKSGFNNLSYFTRQFKKQEGLSPKQYQQKIRTVIIKSEA